MTEMPSFHPLLPSLFYEDILCGLVHCSQETTRLHPAMGFGSSKVETPAIPSVSAGERLLLASLAPDLR